LSKLKVSLTHVVVEAIAGYVIVGILFTNILCAFANDYGQLHFPVGLGGISRYVNGIKRATEGAAGLHKEDRDLWNRHFGLLGMLSVVESNAQDLGRSSDGRAKAASRWDFRQTAFLGFQPLT
jgi:hypothetical protein